MLEAQFGRDSYLLFFKIPGHFIWSVFLAFFLSIWVKYSFIAKTGQWLKDHSKITQRNTFEN